MFMSSPFRASHRRSRSHTSLSSPSSSPVATSDRHRSYSPRSPLLISNISSGALVNPSRSPFSATPAFTAQPPEKWDVDAWRRGKRASRDTEGPSEDADMESCDEFMPSSPIAESHALSNPLSMSAPSTPLPRFAATSDAFHFFPPKASSSSTAFPSSGASAHAEQLEKLHSDAFNDLRKTVSEAGEGFVRRMREFEAHRDRGVGSSRVSALASYPDGSGYKSSPPHKRSRKCPSPLSSRQSNNLHRSNVGVNREKGSGFEDEGSSDVEIHSSCVSGSDNFRGWSPSKKRAVSLCALSYQDDALVTNSHAPPFPIPLRSRERSSSPSVSTYSNSSSSEDEDIASSSGIIPGRSRRRRAARFRSKASSSAKYSPPPLSLSFSTSNNSSRMSLGASVPSPISVGCAPSPDKQSTRNGIDTSAALTAPQKSKRTDRAVAAIGLALANGAGSVSDYEGLRQAQGVRAMEDIEAGSLWD